MFQEKRLKLVKSYKSYSVSLRFFNIITTNSNAASGDYVTWKQYEGSWTGVQLGNSGKTIKQIGCLVTSLAIG